MRRFEFIPLRIVGCYDDSCTSYITRIQPRNTDSYRDRGNKWFYDYISVLSQEFGSLDYDDIHYMKFIERQIVKSNGSVEISSDLRHVRIEFDEIDLVALKLKVI